MIVKVDHLALSTNNLEKDLQYWTDQAYQVEFIELNKLNPGIKEALMHSYKPTHDLGLLVHSDGGYNIELINHQTCSAGISRYVLSNYCSKFDCLEVNVCSLMETRKFWSSFGYQLESESEKQIVLSFTGILSKKKLYLKLIKTSIKHQPSYLDEEGIHAVAFVSTDLRKELERLGSIGYRVTAIDTLVVNQRALDVAFVRGPEGELVELISLKR